MALAFLIPEMLESGVQVAGMVAFRMIFIVAAVIVGIETVVVHGVRLFRSEMRASTARASKSTQDKISATQPICHPIREEQL